MTSINRFLSVCLIVLFGSCSFNTNNEILKKNNSIPIVDFDSFYSILDLSSKKTYVVNFWATWCAPCIKELPYFEYINDKYESDSVKVILVSLDFPSQIESKLKHKQDQKPYEQHSAGCHERKPRDQWDRDQ